MTTTFAERCADAEAGAAAHAGADAASAVDRGAHAAACDAVLRRIRDDGIEQVRIGWCDAHGVVRGKTLTPRAVAQALANGVGMVSTILLKDTSDRTAYRVFEPGAAAALPGFRFANNLVLLPDPASYVVLPWAEQTAWLRAEAWFDDATPVGIDSRRILRDALARLAAAGYGMRVGLEVEFHIYRLQSPAFDVSLDPSRAAWPGEAPSVAMIHPGYNLLTETSIDACAEPLRIVQRAAVGLGLPLTSLEIELGPSQVEAVFDVSDALAAADAMVSFRNGVRQALRRAGYLATFVCRPPFANVMASGWHLHQSLTDLATGGNAFRREPAPTGAAASDAQATDARAGAAVALADEGGAGAQATLSEVGTRWLAGLLAHGRAMSVFCAPTINAYGRFRPNAMAPNAVVWGRDNRGAMLRVIGGPGDDATRIENRIGEPSANPYLYFASQVHAGLDGIARGLAAPPETTAPYAPGSERLPASLAEALAALAADETLVAAFGAPVVEWLTTIKRAEIARHEQSQDKGDWDAREYFSRF